MSDLLIQSNGGLWTATESFPGLAQLVHEVNAAPLELANLSTLIWRRNGAQEEFSRVEFSAFDAVAGAWRILGEGTRAMAGWELSHGELPSSGAVRARGFPGNGSHGVRETWLPLGAAAPLLVIEDSSGTPISNGTGEIVFPAAPTWRRPPSFVVRLRNTGTGVMPMPSLYFSGPQAGAFNVLNPPATMVGPQGSLEIVLAFDPITAGPHTARLEVTYPDQPGGTYSIALHGEGVDTISPHFDSPNTVWDRDWAFNLAESKFGTLSLGFVPRPGQALTVLDQTNDLGPTAAGTPGFDAHLAGLPHEGEVTAEYAGQTYHFRANYEGGWYPKDLTLTLIGPGTPEIGFGLPPSESTVNEISGTSIQGVSLTADQTLLVSGRFDKPVALNQARLFRLDGAPMPIAVPLVARPTEETHWAHALEGGGWWLGRAGPPLVPSGAPGFIRLTREGVVEPDSDTDMTITRLHSSFLQPDGRLLISGDFLPNGGTRRIALARLLPDGKRDESFQPEAFASFLRATTVLGLPGGSVISGPHRIEKDGVMSTALVRWLPDGSRDPSFDVSLPGASQINCLAAQADGKLLVGGTFHEIGGHRRPHLARLNADGTVDTEFSPGVDNMVTSIVVQADGKIVLAGEFSQCGGRTRRGLARLLPEGFADPTFVANLNEAGYLKTGLGLTLQADGRLVVAGNFTRVNQFRRDSLARLLNDPAIDSLVVPDPITVRWFRGGSAPETHDVWFEVTTDSGSTWSRLGTGSRINGGWEWRGNTLPASGHVRARARIAGGNHNAYSSLVESVALFGRTPTALEEWRLSQFNSPLNQGVGHDAADPDLDELPNLLEYALGLDPRAVDPQLAPQWIVFDHVWELRVPRPASDAGVTYSAEWSPDMRPDSWLPAEDTGTETEHRFQVPIVSPESLPTRFFRWRVRTRPAP